MDIASVSKSVIIKLSVRVRLGGNNVDRLCIVHNTCPSPTRHGTY